MEILNTARSRIWISRIGVVGALCLALLGARQFAADIAIAPDRDILSDLQDHITRPAEDIAALIGAEKASLTLVANPQNFSDLSLAQTALAASTDAVDAKQALLTEAQDNLQRSLQRSPANPYAWLRLALVSRAMGQADSEIYKYWQLSVMTGPNEDTILTPRIQIAVDLWPLLSASDRQSVFVDIRDLWAHDHGWQIANDASPFMVNVIKAALVTDIKIFLQYDAFEKARQQGIKNAQKKLSEAGQK